MKYREECRHVTMVAKFLDHNKRELAQQRWRRQRERRNYFARASRFFVHFLAVVARLRHETS